MLEELRNLWRATRAQRFKAEVIKANTAMVPEGQKTAEREEAIAKVMEGALQDHISNIFIAVGLIPGTRAEVDVRTGLITKTKVAPEPTLNHGTAGN